MSKHFHDPYRPHSMRPPAQEPSALSAEEQVVVIPEVEPSAITDEDVVEPSPDPEVATETESPEPEVGSEPSEPDPVVEPSEPDPVDEDPVQLDPPPQVGPGSSADAWRAYAAEVTGTPSQEWADMTRAAVIGYLRERGYAVDQGS